MTFPTLIFEAAFGVNPGTVPGAGDWVDLSDRLGDPEGISWSYGRQTELDRMEAGVGSVSLDNEDRALDPANEASVYWPNVRPMTRVRLRATWQSTTYDVFEGFVEAWPPVHQHPVGGWVTITVVDGTKLLDLARTSVSYPQQSSDARVNALLDAASWPAGKRAVDTGQSDVQSYDASDRIVLNALRDTALAENGLFFIAPNGDATFHQRHRRLEDTTVQATIGDGSGEVPYAEIQWSFDDVNLWNDVGVKPDGLTIQRADDQTSIDRYGARNLEHLDVLITTENEALDAANWIVYRLAEPLLRVESILLDGIDDDAMTQQLARQIGDRVTVRRRPATGATVEREVYVEKVEHRLAGLQWQTRWVLSPTEADDFMIFDHATFGQFDSNAFAY